MSVLFLTEYASIYLLFLIRESCKDNCNGLQVRSDNQTGLVSKKGRLCVFPFTSPWGKVLEVEGFFCSFKNRRTGLQLDLKAVSCFENLQTGRQKCFSLTRRHAKKILCTKLRIHAMISIIISSSTSRICQSVRWKSVTLDAIHWLVQTDVWNEHVSDQTRVIMDNCA
jgi:hypothetical protein